MKLLFEFRINPSVPIFGGEPKFCWGPGPPKPPACPPALSGVEKASIGGGIKLSPGKIC